MIGLATTVVDVYRDADAGSATPDVNWFGDEVETPADYTTAWGTPHISAAPASVIERTQRVPNDGDLSTVRYVVGRVTGGTDIVTGDRIVDRKDRTVYRVEGWSEPQNFGIRLDRRLELVATGQTAPEGTAGFARQPFATTSFGG